MKYFVLAIATAALLASTGLRADDHKSHDKHWQVHGGGDGGPAMRAEASKNSDKLVKHVPNGTHVKRAGDCKKRDGHNWCEVEYEGKRGWIREKYLRKPKDD
ncbi:MAG: SH3 domain-containing protein [Halioglobus sp.]